MNARAVNTVAKIPDHIPAHLVRHFDFATMPGAAEDPHKAAAFLFQGPDVFFSPTAFDGNPAWVVTRFDLIREVCQSTTTFSNGTQATMAHAVGEKWELIPDHLDPPEHGKFRALLNPLFAPSRIAAMEGGVRQTCVELVEGFRGQGSCEFAEAFGRPFPVTVFLRLMGLPLAETAQFVTWEEGLLHPRTPEQWKRSILETKAYLLDVMKDRRRNPRDDLASFIANGKVDGRPFTEDEIVGLYFMFYLAGLDTVTSALGFIYRDLAAVPGLRQQLREDPALLPNAIEEFLRAYALVETRRRVTHDVDFHGVTMKKGDDVVVAIPLSGCDDREFLRRWPLAIRAHEHGPPH